MLCSAAQPENSNLSKGTTVFPPSPLSSPLYMHISSVLDNEHFYNSLITNLDMDHDNDDRNHGTVIITTAKRTNTQSGL